MSLIFTNKLWLLNFTLLDKMFTNKSIIIALSILLCAFIIFLAHLQFFTARQSTVQLYGEKQMVLAKQVALGVESFFNERIQALKLIAEKQKIRRGDYTEFSSESEYINLHFGLFEHIILLNDQGQIIGAYPSSITDNLSDRFYNLESVIKFYKSKITRQDPRICERSFLQKGENFVCIQIPVYDNNEKFHAIIFGIIDVNKSLDSIIKPVIEQQDVHTFILNQGGSVIYHPMHPEMIRNNINDKSGYCQRCHEDFHIEKRMTLEDSGWGEKSEIDQEKLLSFSKINLPGVNWSLAIDMPYRIITKANSKQFWMFFILSASMILVVIVGSIILYSINREKLEFEKEFHFYKTRMSLLENIEEAEAKYRSLVEQSPDAIAIYQKGKFIFANEKFSSLFGYSLAELNSEELPFYVLVTPDYINILNENIKNFLTHREKRVILNLQGQTKSKKILDLEISIGRFLLGSKIAYQLVVHDMTAMKIKERENSHREHLAFIGEMSTRIAHEIKNPLASLQAGIQLLESNLPQDVETQEYFSKLTSEVQRVDGIVKGLLSYSREDQLELKQTDLMELVKGIVELNKQAVTDKKILWSIELEGKDSVVRVDTQKIEQVIWNLIINAIQAINQKGEIDITIENSRPDVVQLIISDNGIGISEENLMKLFQPFYSTKSHGTGLGLAISKKIITAHGGDIEIESNKNKGTRVIIRLPK